VKPDREKIDDLSPALPPSSNRHRLTRHDPRLIEAFSLAIRDQVADLRQLLFDMFNRFRAGEAGPSVAGAAVDCFERWCQASYIVPPGPVQTIWNYATQTAHVHTARLLLYRIGEDQGIFEEKISGLTLQRLLVPPADSELVTPLSSPLSLPVIERLRSEMREFAPRVYGLNEFDWWCVLDRHRLTAAELEFLQPCEERFDVATMKMLRLLSAYDLSGLDLDLWREIYQHFLPPEERRQLGGFYTPQELVDLTLDLANYRPEVDNLCGKSLLDPATGSGAFVVSALQRLIEHLSDNSQACHRHLHGPDVPDGERARGMLQVIVKNVHAIDVHPFATFLTFVNFLFGVLPLYARARQNSRNFRLEPAIFSGDSLLSGCEETPAGARHAAPQPEFSPGLRRMTVARGLPASRMAGGKFDLVVGNPPWGGILKGRLAPIFNEHYKKQLARECRDTFTGKLDVYGLFYDKAFQWLKPGGTVALVTQGSFIDKDWAAPHVERERGRPIHIMGLRRKMAEQASLRYLIDLNPFGQIFFGAMNIPCIGVFEKRPAGEGERAIVLLSCKKSWPESMSTPERRNEVISHVRRCIQLVAATGEPLQQHFVKAFPFPLLRLREFGGARWLLAAEEFKIRLRPEWPRVAQLLEPSQGLTVGGKGCLSIFLMTEARAGELGLEKALLHGVIKGHETTPWRPPSGGKVILYPYCCDLDGRWQPAFACQNPAQLDALDFERPADEFEEDWLRRYGLNATGIKRLFQHRRDSLGLIKFPRAAEYLMKFYEQLSTRLFKKRNLRDFGRAWYEFIWPRDAEAIFGKPKIISPRLAPQLRFALDQEGLGIQDSCLSLAVSVKTRPAYEEFRRRLSALLGQEVTMPTVLRYLLAFLNSSYPQELLTTGHRPRPGDVYQVSDQLLRELSIPVCKTRLEVEQLLDAVDACMIAPAPAALETAEARLDSLVSSVYSKA
jgi:hypothetical protein